MMEFIQTFGAFLGIASFVVLVALRVFGEI